MTDNPWCEVSLCVNDPDNGRPIGHVSSVHLKTTDNARLELEGSMLYDRDNPTFSIDEAHKRMRVGRHVYPIAGYKNWYGNWCWDGVGMRLKDAQRLAHNLINRGFTIDGEDQGQPFVRTAFSPAKS